MSTNRCSVCPRCGPIARRCDTGNAVCMIGLLLGSWGGVGHAFISTGAGPNPAGLYVTSLGSAVAALWLIARAFGGRHC